MPQNAVKIIESQAAGSEQKDKNEIRRILHEFSVDTNPETLAERLLYGCDVTINFHPDRISNNGKMIIENLLTDGEYHNQHKTGTSNGGLGGDRDSWERRLFNGAYHDGNSNVINRPKYGALNVHNYADGAAARFGSCFFTVKEHVVDRCTFSYGDSSTDPDVMGTSGRFFGVVKALIKDVRDHGRLLERERCTVGRAIEYILAMDKNKINGMVMGGNLDTCIETHIHGALSLKDDIESLYADSLYAPTDIWETIKAMCARYDIDLRFIPERRFHIDKIGDEDWKWKGVPLTRTLADRVDERFGGDGMLDAVIIGRASRDSVINPGDWSDIGTAFDLFQNFKKLWHYCAFWGISI